MNKLNKGLFSASLGSFWWGVIGVLYFEYITFIGHIEIVIHRCIWTTFILLITTTFFSKWKIFFEILYNKKKMLMLFLSGILIFINWSVWIYAVTSNRIIDASFGYFIFPILSVLFGYIFFKEKINLKRIISISLVFISILYLLFNFQSVPWVGLVVAFSWSFYTLIRKKINIDTDVGLLIESLYILPIVVIVFYYLVKNGVNYFDISDPPLMLLLFLAGPMTVIPLFLFVRGVELSGIGPSGMLFFITPTAQFLLGFFYYNESFSIDKFLSFILIWFAVSIYIKDLYENS